MSQYLNKYEDLKTRMDITMQTLH